MKYWIHLQVYDWAVDAMKFISQDSMDNYMTQEALELLATGLKSFMAQKTLIDDAVFDEISREARFLSNRKLSEQCKMAKRRCSESRHLVQAKLDHLAQGDMEVVSTDSSLADHSTTHNSQHAPPCRLDWRLRV